MADVSRRADLCLCWRGSACCAVGIMAQSGNMSALQLISLVSLRWHEELGGEGERGRERELVFLVMVEA